MIANARMYAVAPAAADAWSALFQHVRDTSGVAFEVIEHPFPLPVSALWERDDLVLAFMCGWPWARGGARHVPVAAPWPVGAGGPLYWSDLVVPADHLAHTLADLAGARIGFTLLDSQSGFSALRQHLLANGSPGFGAVVGPITTPRRVLEAIGAGRVDVAPVDSFAHALLRRHAPELTAHARVIARTAPTPAPMLVASPNADPAIVARLQAALLAIEAPALLEPLCVECFVAPLPPGDYMAMETSARAAEQAGVHDLTAFLAPAAAARMAG